MPKESKILLGYFYNSHSREYLYIVFMLHNFRFVDSQYQAVRMERKGIGFELKESYYQQAKKNMKDAVLENCQLSLV